MIESEGQERPPRISLHNCYTEVTGESSPYDKHVRDAVPSEILPYLFVGSQGHAQNKSILDDLKITHILNITATCPNWFLGTINYMNIQIKVSALPVGAKGP